MGAMVGYMSVAATGAMLGASDADNLAPFCRVAVRVAYYRSQTLISY